MIQRYNSHGGTMVPIDEGKWVKWEDHDLCANNLRREIKKLHIALASAEAQVKELQHNQDNASEMINDALGLLNG